MVFLLVNRFFGSSQAPTGRILHDVARELVARGHTVRVVTSAGDYAPGSSIKQQTEPSVERLVVWQWAKGPRVGNWAWFWLASLGRLVWHRYDACLLLTDPPFLPLAARLASLFRRRPVFWWTMDLYPEALHPAGIFQECGLIYRCLRWLNGIGMTVLSGTIVLGERQRQRLQLYSQWHTDPGFSIVVPPWDLRPLQRIPTAGNRIVAQFGWQNRKIALYAGNLGEGHLFTEFLAAAWHFQQAGCTDWLFVFTVHGSGRKALSLAIAGQSNVCLLEFLPEQDIAHLLSAATVHLISMKPCWEGIIVPSKLYSILPTGTPVLFVGPPDADTATEISRLNCGLCVPPGTSGETVAGALLQLAQKSLPQSPVPAIHGPASVVDFILQKLPSA
jgi:hypothetical protein